METGRTRVGVSIMESRNINTIWVFGICMMLLVAFSGCPGGEQPSDQPGEPAGTMSMAIGNPTKLHTNSGPVSYMVTYSGAKAVTLSEADVTLEGTGSATGDISVYGSGLGSRTVTDGKLGIAIKEGTASNQKAQPSWAGQGKGKKFTVDNTPPTVSISSPSVGETSKGPVSYEITYGGADSITLTSDDILLNVTGNDARDIAVTESGPDKRIVTISDIGGNGTLGISLAPGTASDMAGNEAPGAGPSETFIVTNPGPWLTISEPSADATNTGPVTYTVTYSDADVITLSDADVVLNKTGTADGTVSVSTASATTRTVTVSDIGGYYGTLGISIQSGTAQDMVGNPAPSAGPSATFDVYGPPPTLQPGTGFTGATPQPDPIGEGPGADCKAIARWDVVPFQTFDGIFEIGVVAFHINGIDTVEFSLEGGPWTPAIPVMTENPRTGVKEYWVKLDASLLPDGPCEVRAIAYPTVGIPRVLGGGLNPSSSELGEYSLFMNSNANHTLPEIAKYVSPTGNDAAGDGSSSNPFASIMKAAHAIGVQGGGKADGGIVYLLPGDHVFGTYTFALMTTNSSRWVTLRPAPGFTRNDVRIVASGNGGLRLPLVHLEDLTVTAALAAAGEAPKVWADNCLFTGASPAENISWLSSTSWKGGIFVTNSVFTNTLRAVSSYELTRNVACDYIGGDAFKNPFLVLNCEVRNIISAGTDTHRDAMQFYGSNFENIIVQRFVAVENNNSQVFFARRDLAQDGVFTNSAFVDSQFRSVTSKSQWGQAANHVLFWNNAFLGTQFVIRDDSDSGSNGFLTTLANVSILDCVFQEMNYNASDPTPSAVSDGGPNTLYVFEGTGLRIDGCRFILGDRFGTNATWGQN